MEKNSTDQRAARGFLPLVLRATGWPCLVVGGGRVGSRKAMRLAAAGAAVTVVSPTITPKLQEAVSRGHIAWREATYEPSQLDGFRLVVAATSDRELNRVIGCDADACGVLVCVVSSAEACRVLFPAVWSDGELTVAVHSQGKDCTRSQTVRNQIAAWLSVTDIASATESDTPCPAIASSDEIQSKRETTTGMVYIVGAGPGAADLISLRGYHALQVADAILADRLVPKTFLFELGISQTGKLVTHLGDQSPRWSQEEINRWLVETAQAGRTVVRLKGGDPFVFGRGDSEIEALAEHGVPWEVIPGPTSATAVLTAAGFPLTRHAEGRSFAVATARVEGGRVINALPKADSLVILMGIAALRQVVDRLLADGWSADTPAAIVERGTLTAERRASGPLGELCSLAEKSQFAAPALVVVGQAAQTVPAIQQQPAILFTGLDPAAFRSLGKILHWPAQAIEPATNADESLTRAFAALGQQKIDWIAFTDKQAVVSFAAGMSARRLDARCLGRTKIAALSLATARQLEQANLRSDAVFTEMDPQAVAKRLKPPQGDGKILLVQGSHASDSVRRRLEDAGITVAQFLLHHLSPHPDLGRPLPAHDVIYFVSPTGVRLYGEAYGPAAFHGEVWCLGAATQRALAEYGATAKIVRPR